MSKGFFAVLSMSQEKRKIIIAGILAAFQYYNAYLLIVIYSSSTC